MLRNTLMSDRSRIAIVVGIALLLGAFTYADRMHSLSAGVTNDAWDDGYWVVRGIGALGVALVYRWWGLLPARASPAVSIFIHRFTDYEPPWREEGDLPLMALLVLGTLAVLLEAAFLSVGLLLRAVWEWIGRQRRRRQLLSGTP